MNYTKHFGLIYLSFYRKNRDGTFRDIYEFGSEFDDHLIRIVALIEGLVDNFLLENDTDENVLDLHYNVDLFNGSVIDYSITTPVECDDPMKDFKINFETELEDGLVLKIIGSHQ